VIRFNLASGKGKAKVNDSDEELDLTKGALVCDDDMDRFLVPKQVIQLKRIEISPGNYMAVQIRDENGEPITHQWEKGRIQAWLKTDRAIKNGKGIIESDEGDLKLNFTENAVFGSPRFIRKAHCCYVKNEDNIVVAVCGIDKKPFPSSAAAIVKPISDRTRKINERKPGEDFRSRYDVAVEAQDDVEGFPLPAIYKGKVLFYHKTKGYGFITPCDSTDQQDPANLFFRRQQILVKGGLSVGPRIDESQVVRFQIGIQHNGKPCASFVCKEDGHLIDADPYTVNAPGGVKRPAVMMDVRDYPSKRMFGAPRIQRDYRTVLPPRNPPPRGFGHPRGFMPRRMF